MEDFKEIFYMFIAIIISLFGIVTIILLLMKYIEWLGTILFS